VGNSEKNSEGDLLDEVLLNFSDDSSNSRRSGRPPKSQERKRNADGKGRQKGEFAHSLSGSGGGIA
jgi:hypothetical protein